MTRGRRNIEIEIQGLFEESGGNDAIFESDCYVKEVHGQRACSGDPLEFAKMERRAEEFPTIIIVGS